MIQMIAFGISVSTHIPNTNKQEQNMAPASGHLRNFLFCFVFIQSFCGLHEVVHCFSESLIQNILQTDRYVFLCLFPIEIYRTEQQNRVYIDIRIYIQMQFAHDVTFYSVFLKVGRKWAFLKVLKVKCFFCWMDTWTHQT